MTARNAPCPCGSGKKYKRCHGQTAAAPQTVVSAQKLLDQSYSRLEAFTLLYNKLTGISGTKLLTMNNLEGILSGFGFRVSHFGVYSKLLMLYPQLKRSIFSALLINNRTIFAFEKLFSQLLNFINPY